MAIIALLLVAALSCNTSNSESENSYIDEKRLVMDTVRGYIVASGEFLGTSDYWYGGFENWKLWFENPVNTHVDYYLYECYKFEDDGIVENGIPVIQRGDAFLYVTLTIDFGGIGQVFYSNIFRFDLEKNPQKGWGITNIRLMYTDNPYESEYTPLN